MHYPRQTTDLSNEVDNCETIANEHVMHGAKDRSPLDNQANIVESDEEAGQLYEPIQIEDNQLEPFPGFDS